MQVRPIEFQENFARVPVEAARQQNVLQREPELAQQLAAQIGADEQVLNLNRPVPVSELEGRTVDPKERRSSDRGSGNSQGERRSTSKSRGRRSVDDNSGHEIDLVI